MITPRFGVADATHGVAVIIPCYQAAGTIRGVLERVGPDVAAIYCVDDASDDATAAVIAERMARDTRIVLLRRSRNGGVGAATVQGYRAAVRDGWDVLVKLDADGQMDPALIASLIEPIVQGEADYVKGNRFHSVETVRGMPLVRLLGNAGVSFLSKASSGYWDLFDPTNGFTAIHRDAVQAIPLHKLDARFFFESDLLFRLYTIRARVTELPMPARYGEEKSHLSEASSIFSFGIRHVRNTFKRIIYSYFLRNFSVASVNLVLGLVLVLFGAGFGAQHWLESYRSGIPATAGTVMLSALPFLVGVQLVLSFMAHDMAMIPRDVVHGRLRRWQPSLAAR